MNAQCGDGAIWSMGSALFAHDFTLPDLASRVEARAEPVVGAFCVGDYLCARVFDEPQWKVHGVWFKVAEIVTANEVEEAATWKLEYVAGGHPGLVVNKNTAVCSFGKASQPFITLESLQGVLLG